MRDAVAGAYAARGERARDAGGALVQLDGVRSTPSKTSATRSGCAWREQLRQVLSTVHALTPGAP